VLVAAGVAVIVASGVVAGWPSSIRLAQPLEVRAEGHTLSSPGTLAAHWSGLLLGPNERVAAEDADARLFVVDGHQTALEGLNPDVSGVLDAFALEPWQRRLLRRERITLVVSDRRRVSADNIAGYFFDVGTPSLEAFSTQRKFDVRSVDRIYDGGDIVIFAVRGLW
jgi:hypothetical protein